MKNKYILLIAVITIITGCIYEPPPVFYRFTIVNDTDTELYIQYKTASEPCVCYDTLGYGEEYTQEVIELHCYNDYYKDSLISTFFEKLEITSARKKISIDVYKRSSWKEKLELKGENDCKSGYAFYTLDIH